MDPEIVRHLVFSIAQFLRTQLDQSANPSSCLQEEGAESVEVALQCLETAYGVSDTSFPNPCRGLYDIYSEYLKKNKHVLTAKEVSPAEKEAAEALKNEGNQLMREEKFAEALDCYTRAIAKDNRNAVFYCNRAAAHSKMNNHEEAIHDCNRALGIEPNYSKAYGRMGLAYSALNNPTEAKECYQKALELEPENESYKCNLQIAREKMESQNQQQNRSGLGASFSALGGNSGFNLGTLGNLAGLSSGQPDLQGFLSNPDLMNLATQLMSNPSMQNMMASLIGRGGSGGGSMPSQPESPSAPAPPPPPPPPPTTSAQPETNSQGASAGPQSSSQPPGGLDALLNAGRQLAEQMQAQHPELVEQIRSAMNRNLSSQNGDNTDSGGNGPPNPPHT